MSRPNTKDTKKQLPCRQLFFEVSERSADHILQSFAGFELRCLGSFDLDRFAGLRVAAFAGGSLGNFKGAESYQLHFITFFQSFTDGAGECIQGCLGVFLGKFGLVSDCCNEFCFIPPKNCIELYNLYSFEYLLSIVLSGKYG